MLTRKLVTVSVLLTFPILLYGQSRIPGALNHPAKLEIQITGPDARPLQDMQVYVEVSSFQGGPNRSFTDTSGRADFYVPSGTNYRLTASGPGIATASTSFEIPPGERFHREDVQVVLLTRTAASHGRAATVPAEGLRVPEKAREEFAKGMKELNANNFSKGREHLQKAIKLYPQFDWAYNNIGVTYMRENNTNAAREAFEKAVAINGKNSDAVRNLARIKLAANDYPGVQQMLLKLGPDPHDFEALLMLAFSQLKLNEFDAALTNALKVNQGQPGQWPLSHLIAARVYEIKHEQGPAQAQYQMFLNEAPNSPQAQLAKEGLQRTAMNK